jgi:hypothetical protein
LGFAGGRPPIKNHRPPFIEMIRDDAPLIAVKEARAGKGEKNG